MPVQQTASNYNTKTFQFSLQPSLAWTVIILFIILTTLLGIAGLGKILNIAFPAGAFAVGRILYVRYPIFYISFTWWLLILTPFVRRYADYQSGSFTDPSPILLAPYLVILITFETFWKHLPKMRQEETLPFVLAIISIFYAFLLGIIQNSPISATVALLDWLCPLLFSFYLFINWRDYPSYCNNLKRTFLWSMLVTGAYGIYQYCVAPEWDRFWRIKTGMVSVGLPEPFTFHVWSTMNSNGPFAVFMMASLLLILTSRKFLRFPAMVLGSLTLLLTMVRSSWIGFTVGLLIFISSLKSKFQMRIIATVLIMIVLVIPLATMDPFSDFISERMATLSNVQQDNSIKGRMEMHEHLFDSALTTLVGVGLGAPGLDSGFLYILLFLGWFGAIPYLGGMLLIFLKVFQGNSTSVDPFVAASQGIFIGCFVQLAMGPGMIEIQGVILWGFLSIAMAAKKYYHHQAESSKALVQ